MESPTPAEFDSVHDAIIELTRKCKVFATVFSTFQKGALSPIPMAEWNALLAQYAAESGFLGVADYFRGWSEFWKTHHQEGA